MRLNMQLKPIDDATVCTDSDNAKTVAKKTKTKKPKEIPSNEHAKMCRRNRLSVYLYSAFATWLHIDDWDRCKCLATNVSMVSNNSSRMMRDMRMTGCDTGPQHGDFCDQRIAMRKLEFFSFRCRFIPPFFLVAFECRIEFNLSGTIMMDATVAVPACVATECIVFAKRICSLRRDLCLCASRFQKDRLQINRTDWIATIQLRSDIGRKRQICRRTNWMPWNQRNVNCGHSKMKMSFKMSLGRARGAFACAIWFFLAFRVVCAVDSHSCLPFVCACVL